MKIYVIMCGPSLKEMRIDSLCGNEAVAINQCEEAVKASRNQNIYSIEEHHIVEEDSDDRLIKLLNKLL